ncbi:sensor histidine kinase [Larkinella soli]|uniref:sensor histidine kinase n=1 Tax=Larkinella soli TaxID=1770527 RepID=UPI000FFC06D3|nr:histidine kinase [Larkinella soli]
MMRRTLPRPALHAVFWTVYFLYSWLGLGSLKAAYDGCLFGNPFETELLYSLAYVPMLAGGVYVTRYGLIERFLLRQQYRLFFGGLALTVVSVAVLYRIVTYYWIQPLHRPELNNLPLFFFPTLLVSAIDFSTQLGVAVLLYFVSQWYRQRQMAQQLLLDKREAELELLKSQVQPHFIFNTLNNIYALSLRNSPQTSEMIYRLSSLLDYMLYDSRNQRIPLQHELEYIDNYIRLQKIRYGDHLNVNVTVDPLPDRLTISPLLLLPFVENCFKHGLGGRQADPWIEVRVQMEGPNLVVRIANSRTEPQPSGSKSGIGLQNVRRRLDLLYRGAHTLDIRPEADRFTVCLTLSLAALEDSADLSVSTEPETEPAYEDAMPDRR